MSTKTLSTSLPARPTPTSSRLNLQEGDEIAAEVATAGGLYAISAEFAGFGKDSAKVFLVKQSLTITHLQRRKTERVSVLLDGVLAYRNDGREPGRCEVLFRDLSSTGARVTLGSIPPGLDMNRQVTLNFYHHSTGFVSVRGNVIRVSKRALGHDIGVAFDDSEPDVAGRVRRCLEALVQDRQRRRPSQLH